MKTTKEVKCSSMSWLFFDLQRFASEDFQDKGVEIVEGESTDNYIAEYNGKYYQRLQDAVNAALNATDNKDNPSEAEKTIKLLKDATGEGIGVFNNSKTNKDNSEITYLGAANANIVIDFQGYKYNVTNSNVGSNGYESQTFHLKKGNTITLRNGTITSAVSSMLVQNYSNLTLEGMTLDGTNLKDSSPYTLSNNFGNVTVKSYTAGEETVNSTIIAKEGGVAFDLWFGLSPAYYEGVKVTLEEDTVVNGDIEYGSQTTSVEDWKDKTVLTIKGATVNGNFKDSGKVGDMSTANIKITEGTFSSDVRQFVNANFAVTSRDETTNTWEVKGYDTLAEAIAAASAEDTVTLLSNVTLTSALTISKKINIDLNGHTIGNGDMSTWGGKPLIYIQSSNDSSAEVIINDSSKDKNGAISSTTAYNAISVFGNGEEDSAKLTVNAGTISGKWFGISGNGSKSNGKSTYGGTNITINGGTISATAATTSEKGKDGCVGIYHPQVGTLTVNDGTISGETGIEMRSGTLNVKGGTIEATNQTYDCTANGGGSTTIGAGIAISQHTTRENINVNISGKSTKVEGAVALSISNPQGASKEGYITVDINGGEFVSNNTTNAVAGLNLDDRVTVNVSGGSFTGNLTNKDLNGSETEGGNFAITGGTFSSDVSTFVDRKDYAVTNSSGTWGVVPAVCRIDDTGYASIADAIAAAGKNPVTITLLCDVTGNGFKTQSGQNITIDFDGHTYNVDGTVGSTGTETNGCQLLKGSTVTFKNGKITSDKAKILVQNYSNLTLEGMTLDGTNLDGSSPYTLSNNFGSATVKDSTIIAKSGGIAFDLWFGLSSAYYDGVSVTLEGNTVINGDIEYGAKTAALEANTDWKGKTVLTIKNAAFNGTIKSGDTNSITDMSEANVKISGGTFTSDVSAYLQAGYYQKLSSDENKPFEVAALAEGWNEAINAQKVTVWTYTTTTATDTLESKYKLTLEGASGKIEAGKLQITDTGDDGFSVTAVDGNGEALTDEVLTTLITDKVSIAGNYRLKTDDNAADGKIEYETFVPGWSGSENGAFSYTTSDGTEINNIKFSVTNASGSEISGAIVALSGDKFTVTLPVNVGSGSVVVKLDTASTAALIGSDKTWATDSAFFSNVTIAKASGAGYTIGAANDNADVTDGVISYTITIPNSGGSPSNGGSNNSSSSNNSGGSSKPSSNNSSNSSGSSGSNSTAGSNSKPSSQGTNNNPASSGQSNGTVSGSGSNDTTPPVTIPGNDTTPSDTTPSGEDTTTGGGSDDTTPPVTIPGDDTTPSDTTPGGEDTTTGGGSDDTIPPVTIPGDDTTPADTTPSGGDTTTGGGSDDTTPPVTIPGDDTTPSDTTPGGEDTTTGGGSDDTTPPVTIPGDDTTPPDTTPGGEDTTTGGGSDDTTPPVTIPGDDTTSGGEDTTPGGEDTVTGDDDNQNSSDKLADEAKKNLEASGVTVTEVSKEDLKAALSSATKETTASGEVVTKITADTLKELGGNMITLDDDILSAAGDSKVVLDLSDSTEAVLVRDNITGNLEVNLGSGENSYYQIDDTASGTRSITTTGDNSSVVNNNPNVAMAVTCSGEGSTNITTASSKDTITVDSNGTGTININATNGGTINLESAEDIERLNLETAQDTPDDLFNSIMNGGTILDGGSLNLNGGDSDSNITLNVANKTTADSAETETVNSDDTSTETTAFENNVNTSKKLARLQQLGASISNSISNITKSIADVLKQAMTNIGSLFSKSSGYMEKFDDEEDTEELTTVESESTVAEVTSDATFINLTTGDGTTHKYGFVGKEGGDLDGSAQEEGAVLVGNAANNSGWAGANITGGNGDDTILAGNDDTVNVSSGNDVVKINSGSKGATVKYNALNAAVNGAMDMVLEGSIAGSSKSTMIEGFKGGFGSNADALEIASSDEFASGLGSGTSIGKSLGNLNFNFNGGNFTLCTVNTTHDGSSEELISNHPQHCQNAPLQLNIKTPPLLQSILGIDGVERFTCIH